MKRFGRALVGVVAALILLLLFVNVHAAYTSDRVNVQQTVASGKGKPAPIGNTLRLYLSGDRSLAGSLKAQVAEAIRTKGLLFDEVVLLDQLPAEISEDPVLAIRLDDDRGFWTPLLATRHLKATISYAQGMPVHLDAGFAITEETCRGECADGRRTVTLDATARGLVSLPYIRTYAAGRLAQEAVILVADGLPDHLNPAKWPERAMALARARLGDHAGGSYASFQRVAGCRGGVATAGYMGPGSDWSLMYYDADRDAITETLSRADLQAKLSGVQVVDAPVVGAGAGGKGWALRLGNGDYITTPAGNCSLFGWQVQRHE